MNPVRRNVSTHLDDIPEAHREPLLVSSPGKTAFRKSWFLLLLVGVLISGGLGWWFLARSFATATEQDATAVHQVTDQTSETGGTNDLAQDSSPDQTDSGVGAQSATQGTAAEPTAGASLSDLQAIEGQIEQATLLGHRKYEVASPDDVVALSDNSLVKLKPAAAQKVEALLEKARIEGVQLGTVSGYRTLEDQHFLFFEVKANRGQNSVTRAEVSAPPGYSEHHTGYAIDFVDRSRPETDLEVTFDQTSAFQWLQKNAAHFGLEMSFTKDNTDVSYEPWHWRYVGDRDSLETFYQE